MSNNHLLYIKAKKIGWTKKPEDKKEMKNGEDVTGIDHILKHNEYVRQLIIKQDGQQEGKIGTSKLKSKDRISYRVTCETLPRNKSCTAVLAFATFE